MVEGAAASVLCSRWCSTPSSSLSHSLAVAYSSSPPAHSEGERGRREMQLRLLCGPTALCLLLHSSNEKGFTDGLHNTVCSHVGRLVREGVSLPEG